MRIVIFLTLLLTITSCQTYHMTANSLKQQLNEVEPGKIREVRDMLKLPVPIPVANNVTKVSVPIATGTHMYNGMTEVLCKDNKGVEWKIEVNYLTEARITEKSGRHKIVYFDTMFLVDTLVYASKSHMIHAPIKTPFNINNISKVELQFRNSRKTKTGN